nr:hypothetical protein Iba_chr04aCG3760 [Ipomoea batatas]GMC87890.1 hypothetical protein Iba_chr04eCG4820 [Ipomoea batatas]
MVLQCSASSSRMLTNTSYKLPIFGLRVLGNLDVWNSSNKYKSPSV